MLVKNMDNGYVIRGAAMEMLRRGIDVEIDVQIRTLSNVITSKSSTADRMLQIHFLV